jgi:ribosomal protein S21
MISAEVTKTGNENSLGVIRRFTRRVQGTGIVRTVRGGRYYSRAASQTVKKKQALKRIARRDERQILIKEGKISEAPMRRGGHHREQTAAQQRPPEGAPIAR